MKEINRSVSESEEDDKSKSNHRNDFSEELAEFPHILGFIHKLQEQIERQKKKIGKLRKRCMKLKKTEELKPDLTDAEVQTEAPTTENKGCSIPEDWDINDEKSSTSIVEQVRDIAQSVLQESGFVYEETSGLYYDYTSGYYYDAEQGLYYDGNTGVYYTYDKESKSYMFHSQAQVVTNEAAKQQQENERTVKRKAQEANNKVSDEIHELITGLSNISIERYRHQALDLAKTYPPCMRIIVKETNLSKIKVGALFLVTYIGGSLGREGDHCVIIPDMNISKHHASIQYDEDKKQYVIIDLGSRNGTILNGKRLSVAKHESEPYEVIHGSIIQIGATKLLCHIHNGHETCGHCEPGLLQQTMISETKIVSKKNQHKIELRRLKNKFGVEKNNTEAASQVASGYQDRAQVRRDHVGSSNQNAKAHISSVDTSIAKDNKGFKILSKMGWTEGQSLGKDGDGRTEPIPMINEQNKRGFGTSDLEVLNLHVDPSVKKKQKLWRKTQKRYSELLD